MAANIQNNDVNFRALVDMRNASSVLYKPETITDEHMASTAGVAASKLVHRYKPWTNFDLAIGGTVTDREEIVFVADYACEIQGFHVRLNGAATTGTTSFDLKKNGSTILSGTVNITSSEGTAVQDGTLSATTLAAGDVLSIELSNSSGDGTGPFAWVEIDEQPS